MPGNRKLYARALAKWDQLHIDRKYSVPDDIGVTAVIYSVQHYYDDKPEEIETFRQEAHDLVAVHNLADREAVALAAPNGAVIDSVLRNRAYSSIIMIGHGALSYVYVNHGLFHGDVGNRYDWLDASRSADHLKRGVFEQRHCGNEARLLSVPLGQFVMASHADVFAPVGQYFAPTSINDPINRQIQRVTTSDRLSYNEVKLRFDYQEFQKAQPISE